MSRNRFTHAMASCFEDTLKIAYAPTTSRSDANGPSLVAIAPPCSRTRAPAAVGSSPAVSTNTPACAASPASLAMACMSSGGGAPTFDLSEDLVSVMNRIGPSLHLMPAVQRESYGSLNDGVMNQLAVASTFITRKPAATLPAESC